MASAHTTSDTSSYKSIAELNFDWLLKLRWSAIAGQIVTIAVVRQGLGFDPPLGALSVFIGLEVVSNLIGHGLSRRGKVRNEAPIAALMILDLICLTGLLYFTGGPHNPFNFLYLVHIALSSVVLQARWTWILASLSAGFYGMLFLDSVHMGFLDGADRGHMWMHLEGMWVAFMVAATFITYFVHRVTSTLRQREEDLARAREEVQRDQRLVSLATLAAGAAHELATPMSTIAVLSRELELELEGLDKELAHDAQLIRDQVGRCRAILDQMAADAGQDSGEALIKVPLGTVLDDALELIDQSDHVTTDIPATLRQLHIPAFPTALTRALRGVIKNAIEASPWDARVFVSATTTGRLLQIKVQDHGHGMAPEVLERIGEPFFTSKDPGKGMGLGIFLTRTVLERMGGELHITSVHKEGTVVTLDIPLDQGATDGPAAHR